MNFKIKGKIKVEYENGDQQILNNEEVKDALIELVALRQSNNLLRKQLSQLRDNIDLNKILIDEEKKEKILSEYGL